MFLIIDRYHATESRAMPGQRFQFTIRGLMITVAGLAVLMAILPAWLQIPLTIALIPMALAVLLSRWLTARGRRRQAAIGFWGGSVLVNASFAAACLAPTFTSLLFLFFLWIYALLPVLITFGTAWANLASREGAVRRRSRVAANTCVFVLTMFPVVSLGTLWPLYLAFFVSRPSLERLADQVAAGRAVVEKRRVGVYIIVESRLDPASGDVSLLIEADPNGPDGPSGFVRLHSLKSPNHDIRPLPTDMGVDLWAGWSYAVED